MPRMWGDWPYPPCSILANPSGELWRSRRGQHPWEGRVQHRWWQRGALGSITEVFHYFLQSLYYTKWGKAEGTRGSESCPLLISTYDCKHSFAIPSNCILPDKLLLLFPLMFYLSASSIHWFCDREEKNL